MASKAVQIRKKLTKYIRLLKKEISVDRVILFGSHVWGHPKPYSDIDIAVFSRDFRDKDEIKNMQYLFKKACEVDPIIEPLAFHPKDLKNPDKRSLLYQIVTRGKELKVM